MQVKVRITAYIEENTVLTMESGPFQKAGLPN